MALVLAADSGYVAAAYGVFLALLVSYVAILAVRHRRTRRELEELERRRDERRRDAAAPPADREPETVP